MSKEQELLVRKAMGAVNEGDIETIVAMIGPETEYERPVRADSGGGGLTRATASLARGRPSWCCAMRRGRLGTLMRAVLVIALAAAT
jgi:hypothetical protein